MDIADWFNSLPRYKRRVAKMLASSETTKATARKFGVSPGRISQTRRELETAWRDFQGEVSLT
jgi:transposase-like protein